MLLLTRPAGGHATHFARGLRAARQFLQREGHLDASLRHVEKVGIDHVRLGIWPAHRRRDAAQLTARQADALAALGMPVVPRFLEPGQRAA